jgi:hypothetical protein
MCMRRASRKGSKIVLKVKERSVVFLYRRNSFHELLNQNPQHPFVQPTFERFNLTISTRSLPCNALSKGSNPSIQQFVSKVPEADCYQRALGGSIRERFFSEKMRWNIPFRRQAISNQSRKERLGNRFRYEFVVDRTNVVCFRRSLIIQK